jgi:probable addiction module antidote protein
MTVKTTPFDPAKHLDDEQAMADYLTDMLEDGSPALLAAALGDIARARSVNTLKTCQIGHQPRDSLLKQLSIP